MIVLLESKLTKLEVSLKRTDRIKNSTLSCLLMQLQKQVELKKQYFKNKNLIVYVNHVLLGFYLCQSRIHKYYGFNSA